MRAAQPDRKYFNKFTEYNGVVFHSKSEADFARSLDLLMHAQGKDRVESWERQIRFPIVVNDERICDYICDFLIRYTDGRKELVEVKGVWTPEATLKVKLFRATFLRDHPEINYRIQE